MPEDQALKGLLLLILIMALPALGCCAPVPEITDLGLWNKEKIEVLIAQAIQQKSTGERIAFISEAFLGTPYVEHTLVGDARTEEALVIRLDGVDCFTFLDYVEALRGASDYEDFVRRLVDIRYKNGQVNYLQRNHFFSDWELSNAGRVRNITRQIGGESVQASEKNLNLRAEGGVYLEGYPVRTRRIAFLPPEAITGDLLKRLQTGDYVGIHTTKGGLDVSHTGIIIQHDGKTLLRHASSRQSVRKVVEEELLPYLQGRKGLVVLRPR